MIKAKMLWTVFLLPGLAGSLMAQKNIQKNVLVRIRVIEENTRQISPAMMCIFCLGSCHHEPKSNGD